MLPGTTAPQQPQGGGNPQHPPGLALVGQGYGIGMFLIPTALGRSGSAGENGHRARSGALLSSAAGWMSRWMQQSSPDSVLHNSFLGRQQAAAVE